MKGDRVEVVAGTRSRAKRHERAVAAESCHQHDDCIRVYRPDGAVNEAGWWDVQWLQNAWHVRGPDPADAGFPTLGGPIDKVVVPEPDTDPIAALLPYLGDEAVMAWLDILLPSDQEPAASSDQEPAASSDQEPAASSDQEPAASSDQEPAAGQGTVGPKDAGTQRQTFVVRRPLWLYTGVIGCLSGLGLAATCILLVMHGPIVLAPIFLSGVFVFGCLAARSGRPFVVAASAKGASIPSLLLGSRTYPWEAARTFEVNVTKVWSRVVVVLRGHDGKSRRLWRLSTLPGTWLSRSEVTATADWLIHERKLFVLGTV